MEQSESSLAYVKFLIYTARFAVPMIALAISGSLRVLDSHLSFCLYLLSRHDQMQV